VSIWHFNVEKLIRLLVTLLVEALQQF